MIDEIMPFRALFCAMPLRKFSVSNTLRVLSLNVVIFERCNWYDRPDDLYAPPTNDCCT